MPLGKKSYETYSRDLDRAVDGLWKSSDEEEVNASKQKVADTIREEAEEMLRHSLHDSKR